MLGIPASFAGCSKQRLLIACSRKVLQKKHVSHGYDWMSTHMIGQRPSTLPVFSQWQHASHVPPDCPSIKCSEIGRTWYIGQASSRFPESMHRWKLWILFLSNILRQNYSLPTEPPNHHPYYRVKFCNVVGWPGWKKNRKPKWYFIDLNLGARFKNKCIVRAKVDISYA